MGDHMLEQIGSYDAKTRLPEILRRVENGESFTITNRGRPVADLIPSRSDDQQKAAVAIDNILNARKHTLSNDLLDELRAIGRK